MISPTASAARLRAWQCDRGGCSTAVVDVDRGEHARHGRRRGPRRGPAPRATCSSSSAVLTTSPAPVGTDLLAWSSAPRAVDAQRGVQPPGAQQRVARWDRRRRRPGAPTAWRRGRCAAARLATAWACGPTRPTLVTWWECTTRGDDDPGDHEQRGDHGHHAQQAALEPLADLAPGDEPDRGRRIHLAISLAVEVDEAAGLKAEVLHRAGRLGGAEDRLGVGAGIHDQDHALLVARPRPPRPPDRRPSPAGRRP